MVQVLALAGRVRPPPLPGGPLAPGLRPLHDPCRDLADSTASGPAWKVLLRFSLPHSHNWQHGGLDYTSISTNR